MPHIFANHQVIWNAISSLAVVIVILTMRFFATKWIGRLERVPPEIRRKWVVQIRNASIFLILFGLLLVWATELKTLAVSVVALAAAIVIATKELIQCIMGGVMKVSTKEFDIGDRVEIGAFRGDVISHNFMLTTLYEIGPGKDHHQFTGRVISFPNSLLLNTPVINESITGKYVLHVFKIPLKRSDSWEKAIELVTSISENECRDFLEDAKIGLSTNAEKQIVEAPTVEPRVHISLPDPDKIDLIVRVPTPTNRKGRIEQAILKRFIAEWPH